MTSSLPDTLHRFPGGHDAGKRAAQRVIHIEAVALGAAAVIVWSYAVLTLVQG